MRLYLVASGLAAVLLPARAQLLDQHSSPVNRHLLVAYSWGATNIGDDAIFPGFLSLLAEVRPHPPVVVISAKTANDPMLGIVRGHVSKYPGDGRVVPFPFRGFRFASASERASSGPAFRAFCERWGASNLRAFDNGSVSAQIAASMADDILNRLPPEIFSELKDGNPDAARAFTDAGFVMYASGMVLNFGRVGTRNFFGYTLRNAMPLLIARALGIPYGINGHSFEAIEWPADLVHRPLFKEARFISCRDPDSVEYLRQRDLLCPRTRFGPDSTFFYTETDEPWAHRFMREHDLGERRFITVTVRNAVSQAGSLAHIIPIEREREQMATMRGFIENWIKRTGVPVVLCPESKREVRWHHDNIYLPLSPEAKAKCVLTHPDLESFWNAGKAGALYERAEMIVSMEMHSVIMGLSRGTPTLMIQFLETGRKASMLQEFGLGDWLFDVDEPGSGAKLLDAALKIHADRAAAEARVRSQLPRLKQLGLGVIEEIKSSWRK